MGKIIKFLFFLAILLALAVVGYAYVGPYFGADFSATQSEIRVPVTLDVK